MGQKRVRADSPGPSTDAREEAFYATALGAWVETRMELDRSILTLSGAGVGLLVTLLTTIGSETPLQHGLYAAALLGFLLAMTFALIIFGRNATYLESVLEHGIETSRSLTWLDKGLVFSFALGVLGSVGVGVAAAINRIHV